MLTEKQLQALVGCGEKEDCTGETCPMFEICDNDYTNKVAAEAAKTALAYRKTLERLETVLKQARAALGQASYTEELIPQWQYKNIVYSAIQAIDELEGSE